MTPPVSGRAVTAGNPAGAAGMLPQDAAKAGAASRPDAEAPANRWYMLSILVLIYVFGSVDRGVVSVVAEPLKAEFGLTDAQIGALGGIAYSATYGIFVLPLGWLVDRTNRRTLLSITVTLWSLLTMACVGATNFATLVLARMGVGAAEAAQSPASLSLIADTFPPQQRSTAVGIYYSGVALGKFVVFVAGGWLLMHFGWRTVFLAAGLPGLLLGAMLFFTLREPERGRFDPPPMEGAPVPEKPSLLQTVKTIFLRPALRSALIAVTLSSGIQFSLILWLTSFLVRLHGLSVSAAAIWMGLSVGLAQTLGSIVVGPFADRFARGDPSRLALIPAYSTLLSLAAGMLLVFAPTLPVAIVGLIATGFAIGLTTAIGFSVILTLADANVRGSTLATSKLFSIFVGTGFLPLITGAISDAVGGAESLRWAIAATLGFFVFASGFYFHASRAARIAQAMRGV